ncbi:MAG: PQQ-binding-like beta-propeller repeat protein [Planctomycetaceae bacterium]|nr:PQQ-binding-like beta-propeller repeat protein [Planctomycetaceae bacterium]
MKRTMITLVLFGMLAGISAAADGPSYFRKDQGAVGDGFALPEQFDAKEQLVWRQAVSPGISTPCVHDDLVVLTTWDKARKELATVALDRATGKQRWKKSVSVQRIEATHSAGSPAVSTPACDGKRFYVFFGSVGLFCYDLQGREVWKKEMGPFQDQFGASSSPVLVDKLVVLSEDHDVKSHLIAIDRSNGKTVWKTSRERQTRSYSTPVVWKSSKERVLVVAGALRLTAYDIKTGRPLWWVNGLSRIVDTTPVIAGDRMFMASWTPGGDQTERIAMEAFPEALAKLDKNKNGAIAKTELPKGSPVAARFFRIDLNQDGELGPLEWKKHANVFASAQNVAMSLRPGGRGDVTKTHVDWLFREGLPVVPSPTVYHGVMYMVKNSGILTSLDAATGKRTRRGRIPGRGNYYASLVAGDGKIYACNEAGVMSIIKAGKQWTVIGQHDFGERIQATPVVRGGRMFIRTGNAVYCFGRK